ncbi:ArsR/SmtB family transcription factor [Ancylomarina longa]|uniref:ArsR family transcriptional regulator n=1 Tax=Ancylomarina longa TaxID=2487017 RepID=A0A434AYX1_9BACT|nr:metalloregulator ArsR/SmtB family transcription factor [Ancylomarina longa]RUT79823.1 ArsR family transcriptional regulator [Ancylomarina longa]
MAQAKSELFKEELSVTARYFKALAHPARVQILQFLAKSKSCITGDISDELPLGRTTVNQHIKELKKIGLITGHIEGVKTKYCLDPKGVTELKKVLQLFIEELDVKDYCCD